MNIHSIIWKTQAILYVLVLAILTACPSDNPIHEIVDIPDEAFLQALVEFGVDTNHDGLIDRAEAEAVTLINCSGDAPVCEERGLITSLEGIEAFINLQTLDCSCNLISSLDLSENLLLESLHCQSNSLSELNLSMNKHLNLLTCGFNQLNHLIFPNESDISRLYCDNNLLTELDLSNCLKLYWFNCSYNQLSELGVSRNLNVQMIRCSNNQLSELDLSNNLYIEELDCSSNNLSNLDLSLNSDIELLMLKDMTSLTKVCVWTEPFPPEELNLDTEGSPNIQFTIACTF